MHHTLSSFSAFHRRRSAPPQIISYFHANRAPSKLLQLPSWPFCVGQLRDVAQKGKKATAGHARRSPGSTDSQTTLNFSGHILCRHRRHLRVPEDLGTLRVTREKVENSGGRTPSSVVCNCKPTILLLCFTVDTIPYSCRHLHRKCLVPPNSACMVDRRQTTVALLLLCRSVERWQLRTSRNCQQLSRKSQVQNVI
jgi:hypothetical protein